MTSSIRILTVAAVDSSPSILLLSTNGNNVLINCGEGCQRAFLESPGLRVRSIMQVCLTHLNHTSIGGLPGMILTSADAIESAITNVLEQENKRKAQLDPPKEEERTPVRQAAVPEKRKLPTKSEDQNNHENPPSGNHGLDIYGPDGTQIFLDSLKYFMRRDKFSLRVQEGAYIQTNIGSSRSRRAHKKHKKAPSTLPPEGFLIQTIPFMSKGSGGIQRQVCSFVFRTPPILGQFQPKKAQELGIPRGPLYGKLKNGITVTFTPEDGSEARTVEPNQVVTPGSPGVAVIVIYCPDTLVLEQIRSSPELNRFQSRQKDDPDLDVMVHITPKSIMEDHEGYRQWMQSFPQSVDHVWLDTYESRVKRSKHLYHQNVESPFQAAMLGAYMRSLVNPHHYLSPIQTTQTNGSATREGKEKVPCSNYIVADKSLVYTLIPRAKKGFHRDQDCAPPNLEQEMKRVKQEVGPSGALEAAQNVEGLLTTSKSVHDDAEIIFTGTGSAIPCKHRNVTGIYIQMEQDKAMLLDCGEGTVGQLIRAKQQQQGVENILKSIQAVFISHPHADHHLGLFGLLSERNQIHEGCEPLLLIAPPNLFSFLKAYEQIDPNICGSYVGVNCFDVVSDTGPSQETKTLLSRRLGITMVRSVPVAHCRDSFAFVFDCTAFGRVAYSGDCRPSFRFANQGFGADLLLHEATFENGMEEEAVLKKHSTVGEALSIGRKMNAKCVILTHFSQRYPRIPPLLENDGNNSNHQDHFPIVIAFDFMRVTPSTFSSASRLTDALRMLYPEDEEEEQLLSSSRAKAVMSVPGAFANKDLMHP